MFIRPLRGSPICSFCSWKTSPKKESSRPARPSSSGIVGNVFLTAKIVKPEILIEAMRAGVKEFFSQPLKTEDVKRALVRIREQHSPREPSKAKPRKSRE